MRSLACSIVPPLSYPVSGGITSAGGTIRVGSGRVGGGIKKLIRVGSFGGGITKHSKTAMEGVVRTFLLCPAKPFLVVVLFLLFVFLD